MKIDKKLRRIVTFNQNMQWLFIGVVLVFILNASLFFVIKDSGTFGDQFGVANALFSGLAFAGLIVTILLQRRDLRLQRKDLKMQRKELQITNKQLEGQKEQLEEQNKTLKVQRLSEDGRGAKEEDNSQVTEPLKEQILRGNVHTIDDMKAWLKLKTI